jgi:parallel beta-helix repeat protein
LIIGIILLLVSSSTLPIAATTHHPSSPRGTIYVDDDAPGPGTGTLQDPYGQIQDAIDNATYGDDIKIASGTYQENIIITQQLTLDWHGSDILGSDTGIPIIDGGGIGIVILIRIPGTRIERLAITNSGNTDLDAGIYLGEECTDITILDNEITECFYGIWVKRYTVKETNHEIRNNYIANITDQGILISLSDGNSIYDNTVTNCGLHGIHLLDCNENRIKQNICTHSDFGLIIDVGIENEIENNICQYNNQYGFIVVNTQKTVITNNNFMDNGIGQATWINCRGDKWFQNYWGKKYFGIHIVIGSLRGADISIPWFKIELNPSPNPNTL